MTQRFYTFAKSQEIKNGMINLHKDEEPIFTGSPFFGYPSTDPEGTQIIKTNNILILDLNVIGFIRNRKNKTNVKGLLTWAALNNLEVTPIVGLSEQQRTHGNPASAFNNYVQILKEDYLYDLPDSEVEKLLNVFSEYSPNITNNTELFRDYLVLIKYFYHKKTPLENKIEQFAQIVYERNVPVLAFAFLLGCVFFHVKDNPDKYSQKVVRKVQSDMSISPKKEEKKLWNVASDIMLFMAPPELFFNYETGQYNYSYIASGDITAGLTLSELCYGQMIVNQGTCFGMPGFRPGGFSGETLTPHVQKYLKPSPQQSFTKKDRSDPRRDNLKQLANELQEY